MVPRGRAISSVIDSKPVPFCSLCLRGLPRRPPAVPDPFPRRRPHWSGRTRRRAPTKSSQVRRRPGTTCYLGFTGPAGAPLEFEAAAPMAAAAPLVVAAPSATRSCLGHARRGWRAVPFPSLAPRGPVVKPTSRPPVPGPRQSPSGRVPPPPPPPGLGHPGVENSCQKGGHLLGPIRHPEQDPTQGPRFTPGS